MIHHLIVSDIISYIDYYKAVIHHLIVSDITSYIDYIRP